LTIPKPGELGAQGEPKDEELESPATAAGFIPDPPSSRAPPTPDSEVVVPIPIHTHTLPPEETDGLTSGAVQPPGSTGTIEISRTPTRESSDGSVATTSEDEEINRIQHEQDEEERLIKAGGSGIPIGPVRVTLSSFPAHFSDISTPRMAPLNPYFRPLLRNTLDGNAWSSIWTKPLSTVASRCVAYRQRVAYHTP
jgi:RNA polymerase II subunit A small phosphatase-like protein